MHYFRRKASSSGTPEDNPASTSTSQIKPKRKKLVKTHSKVKHLKALAAPSSSIVSPVGSPSRDPSDTDETGRSEESGWKTAYGAARMAVDVANASSDMFLPLKAVVGVLAVLIKNYDVGLLGASLPIDR